jgi:ABC-2 type transport system ATP-binding protein
MNQLVEVRQLIRDLGKEKTVIFSSHIMQEIQALCQRVIIIHEGNLVADDPIDKLQTRMSGMQQIIVVFAENTIPVGTFKAIKGVDDVKLNGRTLTIKSKDSEVVKSDIFKTAVENKLTIVEMKTEAADMESVFRQLTKNIS